MVVCYNLLERQSTRRSPIRMIKPTMPLSHPPSPTTQSHDDYDDDVATSHDESSSSPRQHVAEQTQTPSLVGASLDKATQPPKPLGQKRRRVTRACDECRRKKIKCDGKQPCTHCTVYSYGQYACEENAEVRTGRRRSSRLING